MRRPKKNKKVTLFEYETLSEFRFALREFFHFSEKEAHKVGLTPRQHQALLAVKGAVAKDVRLTIGDLAAQLQIRHHSAVGLVNRLIAEELLIRQVAAGDRRRVEISLTNRGSKILEKLAGTHREELRRIGPQLTKLLNVIQNEKHGSPTRRNNLIKLQK